MAMRMTIRSAVVLVFVCSVSFVAGVLAQSATTGSRYQSSGGSQLHVLFDGQAMGADVDVAELTFPPGTDSGDHQHGVTEIFYVLEGELEHIVNGRSYPLKPGMLGFVKPPDSVRHKTAADGTPTKTLVIWAPGGEAARIASRWQRME
jgi:quercetin dioxygenase-like cupin family protein